MKDDSGLAAGPGVSLGVGELRHLLAGSRSAEYAEPAQYAEYACSGCEVALLGLQCSCSLAGQGLTYAW